MRFTFDRIHFHCIVFLNPGETVENWSVLINKIMR